MKNNLREKRDRERGGRGGTYKIGKEKRKKEGKEERKKERKRKDREKGRAKRDNVKYKKRGRELRLRSSFI